MSFMAFTRTGQKVEGRDESWQGRWGSRPQELPGTNSRFGPRGAKPRVVEQHVQRQAGQVVGVRSHWRPGRERSSLK